MSDNDREELINQFTDVTGVNEERATFYLDAANWTLQLALASFFEQDDNNREDAMVTEDVVDSDEDNNTEAKQSDSADNQADTSKSVNTSKSDKETKKKSDKKNKDRAKPRIMTLYNISRSSSEDEDEQGQAFYAGGSERSGQQILGPPKKNSGKDYVSEVFKSAQESGAEVLDHTHASSSTGSAGGTSMYLGTGYRLGESNDDHIALHEHARRASRPTNIEPVILKLWREGFSINNGDLRRYEEAANKEFLESIMKGEIPQELCRTDGAMVHVDLEDHRHEVFKKNVEKLKPFSGKGQTLGSPAPNVITATSSASAPPPPVAVSEESNVENERRANEQLNIDGTQPITMLQVRLADGSRLTGKFNHSHTIADIRNFITRARPQYAAQNFTLLTTFPNKELSDDTATIDKAGLLNAAILQRLK